MTGKQTLLDLAAKVEGLDGPCRETDADISLFFMGPNWESGESKGILYLKNSEYGVNAESLPFTASIDASVSLVPDGWVVQSASVWRDGSNFTLVGTHKGDDGRYWHHHSYGSVRGSAKTEPNARAAAALRARAAERES